MRFDHYMKSNKSTEFPSRILVIDAESWTKDLKKEKEGYPFKAQTLRLWSAIYVDCRKNQWSEIEYSGKTVKEFHDLLDKLMIPGHKLYVYGHNIAYDYTILKIDTYLSSYNINSRVINSAFIINARRKINNKNQSIVFLSTTNYFKQSLKELGKIFGIQKQDIDMDNLDKIPDKIVAEYCMNDSRTLTNVLKFYYNFVKEYDLGNFKMTIASQAITAYRHRFMNKDLLIHTNNDILMMEMASYHGGRCEAFVIGKREKVYKLDVNSMYPYVMKKFKYPTMPVSKKILTNISTNRIKQLLKDGYYVLADCTVYLNKPLLASKNKKLVFPKGRLNEVITSPEIEFLFKHPDAGRIIAFNKVVVYEQNYIFKEYIDCFYPLKVNSVDNKPVEAMAKLFLNSLYGKFAQRGNGKTDIVIDEMEKITMLNILNDIGKLSIDGPNGEKFIKLGDNLYKITGSDEPLARDSIPIISSTVTAYARIYLFELMEIAGKGNFYYCDTDSLFVNERGFINLYKNNMIDMVELGKIKLEGFNNLEVIGAKSYQFGDEIKQKGIKKKAIKLDCGKYLQYQFCTKESRYRKGYADGTVILEPVIKQLCSDYDKGIVEIDGTVSPLIYVDGD